MERLNQNQVETAEKSSYTAPTVTLLPLSDADILRTSLEQTESSAGDLWNWNDLF